MRTRENEVFATSAWDDYLEGGTRTKDGCTFSSNVQTVWTFQSFARFSFSYEAQTIRESITSTLFRNTLRYSSRTTVRRLMLVLVWGLLIVFVLPIARDSHGLCFTKGSLGRTGAVQTPVGKKAGLLESLASHSLADEGANGRASPDGGTINLYVKLYGPAPFFLWVGANFVVTYIHLFF